MKQQLMILAVALASFGSVAAHAETSENIPSNHMNVGMPVAQLWDGIEVLPMCSDSNPTGSLVQAETLAQNIDLPEAPKKAKKMKTPAWAKNIASKADTAKLVMDVVMKQKINVKIKF